MPEYPYHLLADHDVHPGLSAKQLADVLPPLEPKRNEAWRSLRKRANRLIVDFFLLRARNLQRWSSFLTRLADRSVQWDEATLRRELDDDAPLVFLATQRRDPGRTLLEGILGIDPLDPVTAHRWALLRYADAQQLEHDGRHSDADSAWCDAIAGWMRTLADDGYWGNWCSARQRVYGARPVDQLKEDEIREAREKLRKRLESDLAARGERCRRDGDLGRAEALRDLEVRCEIEWRAARALAVAARPEDGLPPCGPLFAARRGLDGRLAALVVELQGELEEYEALELGPALAPAAAPRVSNDALAPLRVYFSPLAEPAALMELTRREEALEALDRLARDTGAAARSMAHGALRDAQARFGRDIGELVLRACLAAALPAITATPARLDQARTAWADALVRGRRAGLAPETIRGIADQAVGRAAAVRDQPDRDPAGIENLSEAIALLETAFQVLGDACPVEVSLQLAKNLDLRGVRLENADRHEEAFRSLSDAWKLFTDDLEILDHLCTTVMYWSRDLRAEGRMGDARERVTRGCAWARSALSRRQSETLAATLRLLEDELVILDGGDPAERASRDLDSVLEGLDWGPPTAVDRAAEHLSRARVRASSDDLDGAAGELESALAILTPGGPGLRGFVAACRYVKSRPGGLAGVREVLKTACRRGFEDDEIQELQVEVEGAWKMFAGPGEDEPC
jgi:tetratricopeptide (TPR) repeat protein